MPGMPIAAQLAAAILGTSLMASDQMHVSQLQEEAAMMTEAMRELEARKMSQTTGALNPKYASAEREISHAVKIAAAITTARGDHELLSYLLEQQGIDKEAGFIGGMARAVVPGIKRLGGAIAGGARAAGQSVAGAAGRLMPSAAKAAPAAAAPVATAAAKSKPLISMGTKAKIIGGGAILGAGYTGMKVLQTARDYMMMPGGGHQGPPVMNNVNQYGYAQY